MNREKYKSNGLENTEYSVAVTISFTKMAIFKLIKISELFFAKTFLLSKPLKLCTVCHLITQHNVEFRTKITKLRKVATTDGSH